MHRQLYKGLLILWIEFRIAHIIGVNGGFMFPPLSKQGPHQGRMEQALCHFHG